jgi:CRP-like cAMP-binding protein
VRAYREALRRRDLRLLFAGLLISDLGNWAYNVALLAYIFDHTHSLGWVGVAGLARFLPALVLSPYAGVVAERYERVRVLVSSDVACTILQALLAVVAVADGPSGVVVLLAGLSAIAGLVYNPAVSAIIPQVAGENELTAANALNGTIENLTVMVGPAIGAGLLVVGSPAFVFAVNAGSFAVSAVIVGSMRARSRPVDVTEAGAAGPLAQMLVGARTLATSQAARIPVALCALVSFVYGTDMVLFVGVSEHRLGTGSQGFGYLLAGLGVGGLLAAAWVNSLASSRRLAIVITAGAALYCLPTALLTIIHSPEIAFALQLVRGAATLIVDVLAVTALQRAVPEETLARVFGVFFAVVLGAISLGTLITPAIVHGLGLNGGLLVMAFAPGALALVCLPALLRLDQAAAERLAELAPRIAILERLGIFTAAPQAVLERLAAVCTTVAFAPDEAIVREGDPADALYVVLDGAVIVTARGESGEEHQLRRMGPETYFGEIGLLERIPRTATVTAEVDTQCYRIDGDEFLNALTTTPPARSLIEGARSRLAASHPSRNLTYETAPAP